MSRQRAQEVHSSERTRAALFTSYRLGADRGAKPAIYVQAPALRFILSRAGQRKQAQQRAVRAEVAAPEIRDKKAEQEKRGRYKGGQRGYAGEKVVHLYIRDLVIIPVKESLERRRVHGEKIMYAQERQYEVFQGAERVIQPGGDFNEGETAFRAL